MFLKLNEKNAMNNDSQIIASKKERLHWLDYSKTIGMYLVILGHIKGNALLLKWIIYSFHMPLFFFLSGFLHKLRIGGGKFCASLVKQLVIPFFIFNGLTLLTKIRNIQTNGLIATLYDFFGSIFLGEPPVGPTWFILSLIWMKIIMFILLKFREDFLSLLIIEIIWIVTLTLYYTLGIPQIPNYFHLGSSVLGFPFYLAGFLLKLKYKETITWIKSKRWTIGLIFIFYIIGFLFNGFVSLEGCKVGNHILLMYLTGLCGTLLTIASTHLLKRPNKWVYVLSCGMIVILCTHGFILNMTINKFPIFEINSCSWYIYAVISCIIIMIIEIPIILFCSRYFKWAMGGRPIAFL